MKHILITILLLLSALGESFAEHFAVRELPLLDRLPERGILKSFRDSEGYLWYATTNGLCRDDGYDITVFRTLNDNYINSISEDADGRIWIATRKGASYINKKDYRVADLDSDNLDDVPVKNVFTTSDGSIWVNCLGELRRYDRRLDYQNSYEITDRFGNPTYVSGFVEDRHKQIYMTSFSRGVYLYDGNDDMFSMVYQVDEDMPLGEIIEDNSHDYFWINNLNGYIYRFDPSAKGDKMFTGSPVYPKGAVRQLPNHVYSFAQDNVFGYIWACVRNHLIPLQAMADGTLEPIEIECSERFDGKMIDNVYADGTSLILSAYDSPSSVIYLSENNVTEIPLDEIGRQTNFAPVINAVATDSCPDYLWLLQSRSGLLLYDLAHDRVSSFSDFQQLKNKRLHMAQTMARSKSANGVWVSPTQTHSVFRITHRGLDMHLSDSLSLNSQLEPTEHITALHEDNDGRLWIGSTNALFCYSPQKDSVVLTIRDTSPITSVTSSFSGDILAATSRDGFIHITTNPAGRFDINRVNTRGYNFTAIAGDRKKRIWLGTDKGQLARYNLNDSSLVFINRDFEFNSALIRQLHVDHKSHIWIVTDQNIVEYNPDNGSFRRESSSDDAITLTRFLSSTPAVFPDGRLAVGGVGGINLFRSTPALDEQRGKTTAIVSDVLVNGKSMFFSDSTRDSHDKIIALSPDDRNIELRFTTLDHRNASKTRFAYRIAGLDEKWNHLPSGHNSAFINRLEKGNYELEIKACDENGLWGDTTVVEIRRSPAVYETWWAYTFYGVAACLFIYYIARTYIGRINRRNDEIWTDSSEMIRMRDYLKSSVTLPEDDFIELDKILLDKATKEVEKHLADIDFDVNRLAEAMNMSRSSFTRKIKAITGKTPIDFIRSIRMQHAYHLLERSGRTVAEAAEMVGYLDRRYFTASFKREFGMTPSECQRRAELSSEKPTES